MLIIFSTFSSQLIQLPTKENQGDTTNT